MNSTPIRLMVVASVPHGKEAIQGFLGELEEHFLAASLALEVVGVAYNKRSAIQQFKNTSPDIVLVDVMNPGQRHVEVVAFISATSPETKILALTYGDPPHDRVILALQAGALGFVSCDGESVDIFKAMQTVLAGETYLPRADTFDILQAAASDLIASKREKRAQFFSAMLGLIPAAGILAAFTGFLWREYWGQVGVRVGDLGVDATSRVTELLVSLILLAGLFGPLLFVDTWLDILGQRMRSRPHLKSLVLRAQGIRLLGLPLGKIVFHRWAAYFLLAVPVMATTIWLNFSGGKILSILIGVIFTLGFLAHLAGLSDSMPRVLVISRERAGKAYALVGGLSLVLLLGLSTEIFLRGPDLRHDGLHGFLVPKMLDVSARPAMFYDLDGKQEPLGALYLGGNADLYVLYDPNTKSVRMIPVGSTRVEVVKEVPRLADPDLTRIPKSAPPAQKKNP